MGTEQMTALAPFLMNLFFLLGGIGLEPGVPPAEMPPALLKVAPENCILFYCSSGLVAPDPDSANQTEQLLAEPEIAQFTAVVDKLLTRAVAEKTPNPEAARILSTLLGQLGRRPLAMFIEDAEVKEGVPVIKAGIIIDLGDQAIDYQERIKTFLEENVPPGVLGKVRIAGIRWTTVQVPDMPMVAFTFRGRRLIAGVDRDALEGMIERLKTPPPAWLATIRDQIEMERIGTLAYVDLKRVRGLFGENVEGIEVDPIAETLGLSGLARLYYATGLDADGFVVRSRVTIEGPPRGLFTFLDIEPLSADDVADIPDDATFAGVVRFDADKAFDAMMKMIRETSGDPPQVVESSLNVLQVAIGINLKRDVLQALGDRACVYNSPGEGGLLTGTTVVIDVKDPEKLAGVQDRLLLMARLLMPASDPRDPRIVGHEFEGYDIYTLDIHDENFMIYPSWCIADEGLLFALYPQSIKSYLSRGGKFPSLAERPEVAGALAEGQRTLALGYVDSRSIFETVYTFVPPAMKITRDRMSRESEVEFPPLDMFPSAGCISRHLRPSVVVLRRTDDGLEMISRQTVPSANPVAMSPVLIGLLLPGVGERIDLEKRAKSIPLIP